MVSALVQRFRNDIAPRLLTRFDNGGVEAVVRAVTPNPDPLLPPVVVDTSAPIKAVARGASAQFVEADPNLVASDLQVIVAATDYTPVVGGTVEVNGKAMRVIRLDAIPAAGDPAAYRFFVR